MHKTLHKSFTEKHYPSARLFSAPATDEILATGWKEMRVMREAAKDLLQPRPEAIAYILKMSRQL